MVLTPKQRLEGNAWLVRISMRLTDGVSFPAKDAPICVAILLDCLKKIGQDREAEIAANIRAIRG